MRDFYFYESGRKLYYFGRLSGNNEHIGWHITGKMGGLWFGNTRILSSVKLLKKGENIVPSGFINKLYYRTLYYGKTRLNFLAHPLERLLVLYLENAEPDHELALYLEQIPTIPGGGAHRIKLKILKRLPLTIISILLNHGERIFITVKNASVHIHDDSIVLRPKMKPLLCIISEDAGASSKVDFASMVRIKQDYYSRYLPRNDDSLRFWAQVNALELYFERKTGRGYVAGLPEFPWWFGIDTVYTALGLLKTPQLPLVRSSISNLAHYGNGLVPHEVTTTGTVHARGRMNEIVSFAYLVLKYTLETGEREFLELIDEAMKIIMPNLDENCYPVGEGIVEVPGTERLASLDVACWFYKLLEELSGFSHLLKQGRELLSIFETVRKNFFKVWKSDRTLFYDMIKGNRKYFIGHFIQIYPLAMGLVPHPEGKQILEIMKNSGFFNEIGMIHSLPIKKYDAGNYEGEDKNSIVWSLPTLLALKAARNYADKELLDKLLNSLQESLHLGMKGALPEILPQGGCIAQSWNAYVLEIV